MVGTNNVRLVRMAMRIAFFISFLVFPVTFQGQALAGNVKKSVDVLIVGAGLSGLVTAYELKKAGLSAHILEIAPRIGGRVRTVRYKIDNETTTVDSGMEEYWESNPAVKYIKELKLKQRSDVAVSSIVLQNNLYSLGNEEVDAYQKRIFSVKELSALNQLKKEIKPISEELHHFQHSNDGTQSLRTALLKLKDVPFSDWITKTKKLPPKVAEWIRVSVECEIGTEWNQISALDGIAEFHIFMGRDLKGELSYRVIDGNDAFTEALAKAAGGDRIITTNRRVSRIERVKNGESQLSRVYAHDTETNTLEVYEAKHVVTTIPVYRLVEIQFSPPLSSQKWQAIMTQKYGSYFKAHVFVPRTAERFWTKNDASALPILSDSELGVIYDGNPDHEGDVKVLSLLVSGARAEGFNFSSLDQVRMILSQKFDALWPGFSKEIKSMEFYRYHPRAIAAWPVGRSRFDENSQSLRRPENGVYIAGDFTESSHSDGAFISSARVVRQILSVARKSSMADLLTSPQKVSAQ